MRLLLLTYIALYSLVVVAMFVIYFFKLPAEK